LLAAWLHDEPDSAVARAIAERARPKVGSPQDVDPEHLAELAFLFGDGAGGGTGVVPYEEAVKATEFFTHYYTHAAPFPRMVLRRLWDRCQDGQGRCSLGLVNAEVRVGPL